jgi:hypothetical protein
MYATCPARLSSLFIPAKIGECLNRKTNGEVEKEMMTNKKTNNTRKKEEAT